MAALLVMLPLVSQAREKKTKSIKVVGVTTAVEPTRVSIVTNKGQELSVVCKDDFTRDVAVGSEVTVWYSPRDGVNHLDWLEYPLENFFVPSDQIRRRIQKIIILPNSGVPEADGIFEGIQRYLEANLGWYVAPPLLADEIRRRSAKPTSALDALDPATGRFNVDKYVHGERQLISKIAADTRVDAVLEVNVVQVQAALDGQVAFWDGVSQVAATKGVRALSIFNRLPEMGEVPAATVVFKLWDPEGKLLWSNRRGFATLAIQTGLGNKFRDRPLTEAYQDERSVQQWLTDTLGHLAPAQTAKPALVGEADKKRPKD